MPISAERKKQIDEFIAKDHVFMASKDYCPYCRRAKSILSKYNTEVHVIELNLEEDGAAIQDYLAEVTGQRTVPNIWIDGKHVGGSDALASLDSSGKLKSLL